MTDIIRVMTSEKIPVDWLESRLGPSCSYTGDDALPAGFIEIIMADSVESRLKESTSSWTFFLDMWTLRHVYLFKSEHRETAMIAKLTWGGS